MESHNKKPRYIQNAEKTLNDVLLEAYKTKDLFLIEDRKISDIFYQLDKKDYYTRTLEYKDLLKSYPEFDPLSYTGGIMRLNTGVLDQSGDEIEYFFYFPKKLNFNEIEDLYNRSIDFVQGRIHEINRLIAMANSSLSNYLSIKEIQQEELNLENPKGLANVEVSLDGLLEYIKTNYSQMQKINYDSEDLAILFQFTEIILPIKYNMEDKQEEQSPPEETTAPQAAPPLPRDLIALLNNFIKRLREVVLNPEQFPKLDKELAIDIKLYLFGIFFPNELKVFLQNNITQKIKTRQYVPKEKSTVDNINTYLYYVEEYLSNELKGKFIKFNYNPKPDDYRTIYIFTEKFETTLLGFSRPSRRKIKAIDKTTLYVIFEDLIHKEGRPGFLEKEADRFGMSYENFIKILKIIYDMYKDIAY